MSRGPSPGTGFALSPEGSEAGRGLEGGDWPDQDHHVVLELRQCPEEGGRLCASVEREGV